MLDLILHLDVHLAELIRAYGLWVYAILFAIIFAETGLVVTPILPGDSLLFVAGTLAAVGEIDVHVLVALLVLAAVLGNTVNYTIGRWFGKRYFRDRGSRWLNPEYLERTHAFYDRHGGLAVVISRFVPIIRTYVPFVAGLGAMHYGRFTAFNVGGALLWVASLTYAGYFFGNIPWVKKNLTLIIVAIVLVSVLPVVIAMVRARARRRNSMPDLDAHLFDITRVIQLAVAPVFLLTAIGTLINALTGRLARAVDRRRQLEELLPAYEGGTREEMLEELGNQQRRIKLTLWSIALAVTSALFVCLLIGFAFVGSFVSIDLARVVASLFIAAMVALTGCLLLFLREVFLAALTVRHIRPIQAAGDDRK